MKVVALTKYASFRCLAGACPSTCCSGWNILVDEEDYKRFKELEPEWLRQDILSNIRQRGGRYFFNNQKSGRCAMLDKDGLCRIQRNASEEVLCNTCRKYPRLINLIEGIFYLSMAAIRVSKEGKSALFETTIIQTTDNKYIYTMPVRVDNKLVNFEAKGLLKEIKIEFAPFEFYEWRNISIVRFVEDGKSYLRIRTTTPGIKALAWPEKPVTTAKKKRENLISEEALEVMNAAQATQSEGDRS